MIYMIALVLFTTLGFAYSVYRESVKVKERTAKVLVKYRNQKILRK